MHNYHTVGTFAYSVLKIYRCRSTFLSPMPCVGFMQSTVCGVRLCTACSLAVRCSSRGDYSINVTTSSRRCRTESHSCTLLTWTQSSEQWERFCYLSRQSFPVLNFASQTIEHSFTFQVEQYSMTDISSDSVQTSWTCSVFSCTLVSNFFIRSFSISCASIQKGCFDALPLTRVSRRVSALLHETYGCAVLDGQQTISIPTLTDTHWLTQN